MPRCFTAPLAVLVLVSSTATASFAVDFTPTELGILAPLRGADRLYVEHALEHSTDGILKIGESADWKAGDVGRLETERVKMRVLSGSDVLVTHRKVNSPELSLNPAVRAEHLLGSTVIISGISTATYTNYSRDLALPEGTVFVCLGERSYQEPAGATKKTKEIRAVDLSEALPILEKILNVRGQRTWMIDNRAVRGQARAKASRGVVDITTNEGKTLRVHLRQLSQADQHFLGSANNR